MSAELPRWLVPHRPSEFRLDDDPQAWQWELLHPLPPFRLSNNRGLAKQQTTTRLCHDETALYVRFDCEDEDIWGTYTERNDPIYDEEVVEIFLAPGELDPIHYHEFEISPFGVLFTAAVENSTSQRTDLKINLNQAYPSLVGIAGYTGLLHNEIHHDWWAILIIPWQTITTIVPLPRVWRANFFRIERPRQAEAEYSCWSPTLVDPADFHKPKRFGFLTLDG